MCVNRVSNLRLRRSLYRIHGSNEPKIGQAVSSGCIRLTNQDVIAPWLGNRMHFHQWKRREFITLLGGVAAWPLTARAQQPDQMRRIGVMIALPEGDPELKKWVAALLRGLEKLGWMEGRNVRIDYRFAPAGARAPELAKELLALQPDVLVAFSDPVTGAFQRATRTVPIVFLGIADAIAQGFVHSLAHPDAISQG